MAAPVDGPRDPYMAPLYISIYEHIKFYNKAIIWIPESDRYDLTRYKYTDFYQELEYAISTFGFKSAVFIVTAIDAVHAPTEVKNIILYYPSITKIMVDSHCEILWADNSGAYLGCHPTANYAAVLNDVERQSIIAQQRLRSNILGPWINNSLTTDT